MRKKLLNFIKEKSKEERLQYMFNRKYWEGWMNKVEKIGIVEKEGEWVIKFQGEMEEEEEERGEGVEEETETETETEEELSL